MCNHSAALWQQDAARISALSQLLPKLFLSWDIQTQRPHLDQPHVTKPLLRGQLGSNAMAAFIDFYIYFCFSLCFNDLYCTFTPSCTESCPFCSWQQNSNWCCAVLSSCTGACAGSGAGPKGAGANGAAGGAAGKGGAGTCAANIGPMIHAHEGCLNTQDISRPANSYVKSLYWRHSIRKQTHLQQIVRCGPNLSSTEGLVGKSNIKL
jgi:hypothetical protein